MNKRSRFVILLAVLAICFVFLWPSISWYGRTPKEVQALALGSTENIKDFATAKAAEDVRTIKSIVAKDSSAKLDEEYAWIKKDVAKRYKTLDQKVPAELIYLHLKFLLKNLKILWANSNMINEKEKTIHNAYKYYELN